MGCRIEAVYKQRPNIDLLYYIYSDDSAMIQKFRTRVVVSEEGEQTNPRIHYLKELKRILRLQIPQSESGSEESGSDGEDEEGEKAKMDVERSSNP